MVDQIAKGVLEGRSGVTVAKTPYQRVLEHPAIDEAVKEKLRREHETLNPLVLKREMDKRLPLVNNQQTRHDHQQFGCAF